MSSDQFDHHEDHAQVSASRKVAYGMGDAGNVLLNDTFNNNALLFYNILLGFSAPMVGTALVLPRIIDAITDPLMGQVSDNTRTRWGRRRPYILFGGITFGLAGMTLWWGSEAYTQTQMFLFLTIVPTLYYLCATVTLVPYNALGAELSFDYHERTRIQAVRTFIRTLFGSTLSYAAIYLAGLSVFPDKIAGFRWVGAAFGLLSVALFIVVFLGTREEGEIQRQERITLWEATRATFSNGPFLILVLSITLLLLGVFSAYGLSYYVSIYHVFSGDVDGLAKMELIGGVGGSIIMLAMVPIVGKLAVLFGKKTVFIGCMAWVFASLLATWFIYTPQHPYLQLLFRTSLGVGVTGVNMLPFAMLADICDVDDLRTGRRREGAFNGVLFFIIKCSIAFQPMCVGWIVYFAGMDEQLKLQSEATILNLRLALLVVPAAFTAAALIVALFYSLTESRVREIRHVLEARRQGQASSSLSGG